MGIGTIKKNAHISVLFDRKISHIKYIKEECILKGLVLMNINDFMTPNEAADRWGVKIETLKERLKPSRKKNIDELIAKGLIKQYKPIGKKRGEWILSREFMELYYGKEPKKQ